VHAIEALADAAVALEFMLKVGGEDGGVDQIGVPSENGI
jgi:hypothetical protein